MELKSKFFSELTLVELYEVLRSRSEIFLLEQNIICQDLDRVDYDALHCFFEERGKVVAYLRAFRTDPATVQMGRVLSTTHNIGLGSALMKKSLLEIKEKLPCSQISLHAQTHAKGFYEKLGFKVISDEFLEEGVPHVTMMLKI